jgi:hypothetical protein
MPVGRCEDAEGAHRAGLQGRVESEVEKRLTAGRDVARVQREVEAVGVSNDHRAVRVSARSRRVEAEVGGIKRKTAGLLTDRQPDVVHPHGRKDSRWLPSAARRAAVVRCSVRRRTAHAVEVEDGWRRAPVVLLGCGGRVRAPASGFPVGGQALGGGCRSSLRRSWGGMECYDMAFAVGGINQKGRPRRVVRGS